MSFELPALPVTDALADLSAALQKHDRVILQAPTGAGKTTLVPLYLLQQNPEGKILMLEPRRIAASSAAIRMAELLNEPVGKTVGYRMQLENRTSRDTRIEVVTEGVLTRMIQEDPELQGISILIFDEFHERSLQADIGLALTLQSQEHYREEPLKLLIMSATLQADELGKALNAPVVISEGFSYPVAINYLSRPLQDRSFHNICREVSSTVIKALHEEPGSMLVFLPGAGEIRQVQTLLEERVQTDNVDLRPLSGELSLAQQRAAIQPAKPGRRKVVLATNIAETSLTIEGIRIVVDSGLTRRAVYDPGMGMTRLETRRLSISSADQRKGRAGRLEEGVCYRLWTESEHQRLEHHETAEIAEADLAPLALELCSWGCSDSSELFWLTPPNSGRYQEALGLLEQLEATARTSSGSLQITAQGLQMAALGTHPRIAHMLLKASERGYLRTGCQLAAILSERDLLSSGKERSANIHHRLNLFDNSSNPKNDKSSLFRARQLVKRWESRLKAKAAPPVEPNSETAGRLLIAAYPDRIAQRRGTTSHYLLRSGQGVELSPEDPLASEEYLVIPALGGASHHRNARVFMACAIDKAIIYDECLADIQEHQETRWDSKAGRVIAAQQDRLGALVLEHQKIPDPDPDTIKRALLDGIRQKGIQCLPWDRESLQLRERLVFLNRFNDRLDDLLPASDEASLLDTMEAWLMPYLDGMTKLEHLKKLSLREALLSRLSWPQQQLLDREAPERWQAPSGSNIRVDYSKPDEPKVSLRLQELFGLLETPVIAFHQQPLTIEMLSPAQRPVQITRDLASFWKNTYQEVKKDLKGRYPKHYWPDDPYSATATHRVRPKV
ncbi:ATP-dependent helicase HrpB [Endozoicomonas lisbonensis]|uniref:ATP-dependent helicase HrpB n=1 Tax=Endozoicomonas lisbonensis TaxID=3120522 RepID=A0ABV2SJP5_9GAMM